MPEPRRLQPFPFGDLESLPKLLNGLVREGIEKPLDVVLDTQVEGPFRMTDHEAEVVASRTLDPHDLPSERLTPLLLEPKGGQVTDSFGDEILLGQSGPKMQPNLKSAMRAEGTCPSLMKTARPRASRIKVAAPG